jgi:hypothetical protein
MNFAINLDGDLAASANKDADALERLQNALRAEEKALGAMERQMKALQKATVVDVATFQKLDSAIKASKDKVAGMTGQLVNMGATGLDPAKEKAFNLAQAFSGLQQQAGPVGKFLSAVGPWGVAAAIGLGLIVVAASAAFLGLKKLVELAAQFSEARGDAERMLTTVFDSEKGAERTYNAIEDVTKRVAISQDKAIEVADSLARAGVYSGDAMVRAVESVGKAEAARKGAGQVIQGIIERSEKARSLGFGNMGGFTVNRAELRSAGIQYKDFLQTLATQTGRSMKDVGAALRVGRVSVAAGLDALNATVDRKLGPLADKKFNTIGVATQRLRDTFGRIFDQVDTSKIAGALHAFATWMDDTSVAGYALEKILSGIFDGLGKAIEVATPYVQTFGDFLMLTFLRIRKALKPVRDWVADAFGGESKDRVKSFESTLRKLSDFIAAAFVPGVVAAFAVMTYAFWLAVPAIWSVASGVLAATWPFLALGAAVFLLYKAWSWVIGAISEIDWGSVVDNLAYVGTEIANWFGGVVDDAMVWVNAFLDIGSNIVSGLVNGIKAGWGKFKDAMKDMASAGLEAFKKTFGIASPSKVMMAQGAYIDQGLTKGIEANKGQPTAAMDSMGQSTLGASPGASGGSSGGRAGFSLSVTFAEGSIQISGVKDMAAIEERLPSLMANLFEQLGISMGAEQPV